MPKLSNSGRAATTILLLCAWSLSGHEIKNSSLKLPPSAPEVCPARSINYITDVLPQQCLSVRVGRIEGRRLAPLAAEDNSVNGQDIPSTTAGVDNVTGFPRPLGQIALGLPSASGAVAVAHETHSANGSISASPSSSATEAAAPQETTAPSEADGEGDSPLDNANFLSFEEWKKQNLAKVGQSLHDIAGRKEIGDKSARGRPATINNALDSLGEDTEIEIDFGGFVNPGGTAQVVPSAGAGARVNDPNGKARPVGAKAGRNVSGSHRRSKDAGKTCKERFNYASFDCAATVLKTNKECKGSTSVLVENKDSYMLNKCSAENKFFIVELCDDILVDTVVLANFEFFSSMFRTFRVSVSDQYPVKLEKWRELGTFEARNSREVQAFLVESPLIWARYLRIEFLAHYGNEYYCPVSLLRVHGTTMMEEFNREMKGLRGEEEAEGEIGEGAEELASDSGVIVADALKKEEESKPQEPMANGTVVPELPKPTDAVVLSDGSGKFNASKKTDWPTEFSVFENRLERRLKAIMQTSTDGEAICAPDEGKVGISSSPPQSESTSHAGGSPDPTPPPSPAAETEISVGNEQASNQVLATSAESASSVGATEISHIKDPGSSTPTSPAGVKHHTSTHPPAANPTTQESFFKTIHKRLQLLEANSTLSLQYIEDQSRILRDAFTKVEKRQLHKMTTFLESLNATVLTEVRNLQAQYDQLWQSTVLELSAQREQSRHEIVALSARLSLLADETLFQKRIAILQSMLILLCLGLVIFTRTSSFSTSTTTTTMSSSFSPRPSTPPDGPTPYADFPSSLLQNVVVANKSSSSSANSARYTPHHLETTPTTSPPSTRPSSRYGIFFSRGGQENMNGNVGMNTDMNTNRRSPSEESAKGDRDGIRITTTTLTGNEDGDDEEGIGSGDGS